MESNKGGNYHGEQETETNGNGFLVSEETENVKPTGVDDESTGMGEGDSDYLGKTNKENRNDD